MKTLPLKFPLVMTVMILCFQQVHTENLCATNSAEFQAALDTAENNGQDNHITLERGNYPVINGSPFSYTAAGTEGYDLKISGGYISFLNNPCALITLNTSAFETELDGESQNDILRIYPNGGADVTISALAFIDGNNTNGNASGLIIASNGSLNGTTVVENNVFLGNEAKFSSALLVQGGTRIIVRNNLFIANHSETFGAVSLSLIDQIGIYFTNNTVVANTTQGTSSSDAASIFINASNIFIANNILWNNEISDLYFTNGTFLYNNVIGSYTGFPVDQSNNTFQQPEFESTGPGVLSFTPAYNSNIYNQGIEPPITVPVPTPFELDWKVGTNDTFGYDRVVNGRIDIGSFETPPETPIFISGFEG